MKRHLALAALLIGCGIKPTPNFERLEVAPIPKLAAYQGGKIFHPYRWDLDESARYPLPAPGMAPDLLCWLGDSYFVGCLIYECDAALTCPTGWECRDVRFSFDPPQDGMPDSTSGRRITWRRASSPKGCAVPIPQ